MKYLRKLLAIVDNGTIILGKYAFPNIPTLPAKVLLVEVNAVLKKFQLIIQACLLKMKKVKLLVH